jgi:hypothetical protein
MDYPTFKKNLAHAGLSIREFADLLHMNKNSITNYAQKGEVPAHLGIIAQLIVALADRRVDYRKVLAGAPIRIKHRRGLPFGHPFRQKKTGSAQTQPTKPRFWYPADLVIPDKPVPEQRAAPEVPPVKTVKITRRGRRKEMDRNGKAS